MADQTDKPFDFSDLCGPALLHRLGVEAKKSGDGPWYLVRQLGHFERERDRCRCRDNTCGGCTALVWMIARIEELTAEQRAKWPERYEQERSRVQSRAQGQQELTVAAGGGR